MSESLRKLSSKRNRPKVPLDQRKRIVKACTQCRLRKRRCIPESPSRCWNCTKHSLICTFETNESSPTESSSSHDGVDLDHDDVVSQFNKSYPEVGLKAHHSSLLLEIFANSIRKSGDGNSKKGCKFCHTMRHTSQHEVTPIPTEQCSKARGQPPGDDMLSHKEFLTCAAAAVSQSERQHFSDHITSSRLAYESDYKNETILKQDILKDFPSRARAEVLISAFFFYAEANWYYFDESSFKEQLFELYDSDLSPTFSSLKFICLVLTVFALGSHFVHLYHVDNSDNSETVTSVQEGTPGIRYFQHAQRIVYQIITSPSLEGLLSCLLLALYVLPIHDTEACYIYLGLALRTAIILGLHRKQADSTLSPPLSEIHNRVFWTTYSIERRVALSLGYPETLQTLDVDCLLPQRNPDLDVQGSFRAERLLAYTQLTLLLNKVVRLRTLTEHSTRDIRSQLLSWKTDLPAQLTTLDGNCLRPNVHLQLHYSMIWIYVGRGALINKVRNLLNKKEHTKDNLDIRRGSQELSDACAEHAVQIIDLIDLLRIRGQLGLFSHTDFHTCSSATIIVLLDSILNPRLTSFPKVRKAMGALRYMATGSELAKNSLKYVDNFQGVVNKALASIYRRNHEEYCFSRDVNPLTPGEPHEVAGTEEPSMSYPHENQGPNMALLYDIETLLEDCSLTELHLLGFDSLYSSNVLNWNSNC